MEKLIQQTIQGRLQFNSMEISKTNIDGVLIIEPKVFKDLRHAILKDFDTPFSIDTNLYPELI